MKIDKMIDNGSFNYTGIENEMIELVKNIQLKDKDLWEMVAEQFDSNVDDDDRGWRCEYWGKLMRGACVVYEYSHDEELYELLVYATEMLISKADSFGRIATYSVENEFCGWDMWGRKYVLLGLIHFMDICKDEALKKRSLEAAKGQLDYIISKVGPGKIEIFDTSAAWSGINSSSILEPVVRLYNITNESKYLDFAKYIVESGAAKDFNIFETAYEDKIYPYEYPVVKAYELMSCMEGALEYYKVTGEEKLLTAVTRFAQRLIESEITIIGSAGCKDELFNNSVLKQTFTGYNGIIQETCVTVTWMKLCFKLLKITGDSKYADEIEKSIYNALYGSVNTENRICSDEAEFARDFKGVYLRYHSTKKGQIFDSYSPLRSDIRGRCVGGFRPMRNKTAYCGCCVAIGAVGIGIVPRVSVLQENDNFAFMLYINGTASFNYNGNKISFVNEACYPSGNNVSITMSMDTSEEFGVKLRIPYFSKETKVAVNGIYVNSDIQNGYIAIRKMWNSGDKIDIHFDMNLRYIRGMKNPEDSNSEKFISFMYGPLVLARDARIGSVGEEIEIGNVDLSFENCVKKVKSQISGILTVGNKKVNVIDYASSGKTWDRGSETEAWMITVSGKANG